MIAIVKANINNLVDVWRIASTPFNACVETPDFSWCSVPGLEWPNKLWFNGDITEEVMRKALDSIPSGKMVIPYWNATEEEIIIAQGGIKGSEQMGWA